MNNTKIEKQVKAYAQKVYASTPFSKELTDAESEHVIAVMRVRRFTDACARAQKSNGGVCICASLEGFAEAAASKQLALSRWQNLAIARSNLVQAQVRAFEDDLRRKALLVRAWKAERKHERNNSRNADLQLPVSSQGSHEGGEGTLRVA